MNHHYRPEPIARPRKYARLPQCNKSNRRMRRYYAALRRREIPRSA
jgi:hypothetical protein